MQLLKNFHIYQADKINKIRPQNLFNVIDHENYQIDQYKYIEQYNTITHVLLVTLVCKNKYRAPSRCIHDPTFRHSSLVSLSGVI